MSRATFKIFKKSDLPINSLKCMHYLPKTNSQNPYLFETLYLGEQDGYSLAFASTDQNKNITKKILTLHQLSMKDSLNL